MCTTGVLEHGNWDVRINAAGYKGWIAENVAWRKPAEQNHGVLIAGQWKNSPGHYANMVNPIYNNIGLGYMICKDGGVYWTADFAKV